MNAKVAAATLGVNDSILGLFQIAAASLNPRRDSVDNFQDTSPSTLGSSIQEITDRVIEELRRRQDRR